MHNSTSIFSHLSKFKSLSTALFFFLFILFSFLFNSNVKAQGNLEITPKRVVFEGQKRITEVKLVNIGSDSANYAISFKQYRMTEDGTFQEITTPDLGQNFSDKNIRYFPRSVMLAPNESQVIKLQLIRSELLGPGEYRSHLYFRSLTPPKALGVEDIKKDSSLVDIKLLPIFGITIPVIIRVGESNTTLNITDIKLEKTAVGTSKLDLTINRIGNMSAYGDLSVLYIDSKGKEIKIGLSQGIAIYSPNLLRRIKIELDDKPSVDLNKGTIRVLFSSQSETRPQKLAEVELIL